jgi:magnesium transporter
MTRDRKIDESMENSHLLDMFGIEKSLIYYLNGIHANLVVMERLKAYADRLGLEPEQKDFLDDILIENQQCNRQAEIYASVMAGLTEARGSIVNNNLSVLIKRLTIVSVVFLPLNVIAGIGGMSEYSAMTEGIPFHISYPLLMAGLGVVAFITYWAIQRMSVVRKKREGKRSRLKLLGGLRKAP